MFTAWATAARILTFLSLILGISSFAKTKNELSVKRVSVDELPKMRIDDSTASADSKSDLQLALNRQLAKCSSPVIPLTLTFEGKTISRNQWCVKTIQWFLKTLNESATLDDAYQKAKIELEWYRAIGREETPEHNDVLFTGYYTPRMKVKKKKDSVYRYPVYKMPSNGVAPHYTREQIVKGVLNGKGLEIGYASNPVDPYLMEVQGSGVLLFQNSDGTETNVHANNGASNGYDYVSLGKLMREAGIDESYISLQGIRRYFIDEHPEEWEKFSNQNQSYVFFVPSSEGPYGRSGVVVTPGHTIAIDRNHFPMGAISLVHSEKPQVIEGVDVKTWQPFAQFMVAQDTGGAIKGAGHVDVYWGHGDYAEITAGQSVQVGQLFFGVLPEKK